MDHVGDEGTAGDLLDIVVVEDHGVVAEAVSAVLGAEPDMRVVGLAATAADGVRMVRRLRPHVVILDYQLPDGTGTEAAVQMVSQVPGVAVIMLTAASNRQAMVEAMTAGCRAFVGKDRGLAEVIDTVRAVRRGEMRFNAQDVAPEPVARSLRPLAPRELEVLRMLAEGSSTTAISRDLLLSTHTVRNHVRSILAKLGAHSKLEAVAIAHRQGLVPGPQDRRAE